MTSSWRSWGWKLGLASWFAIGGAIAGWGNSANAQIIPDSTLGSDNSTVTSIGPVDQIDGGAIRGTNLFQSFQEFNVDSGRSVLFTNPVGVENILSRVTGTNPSNILGTLGILGGNANLFLINPNGIIFGPNARLNVGGSFVGTTANAIGLASGDIFSANPVDPLPTALLNVNPNAFLFNQIAPQSIINRSIAEGTGLKVLPGQDLLLVGDDIGLEGGRLQALGGRVELGGVASTGTVGLSVNGSELRLSFPKDVTRADVFLTQGAQVNVRAGGGGSIAINTQNLNIAEGSRLLAGIDSGSGSTEARAGDIEINATGTVNLANESAIENEVLRSAVGNGGSINIMTGSLIVTGGSRLNTSTLGQGNGGDVKIIARDTVSFDGVGSKTEDNSSGTVSRVGELRREDYTAEGKGGNIDIMTGSLLVTNGATLSASTFGQGDAGNVTINARNRVLFDGVAPPRNGNSSDPDRVSNSSAVSRVGTSRGQRIVKGNGGNITITTGSLFITNGARLNASTSGQGDAGNVTIKARDTVTFTGAGSNGASARAVSRVQDSAVGNGGNITITTGLLSVRDGAVLSTSTLGQGNGGNIILNANTLEAVNGGQVITTSLSAISGKAGNITLNGTDSITLAGSDPTYSTRLQQRGREDIDAGPTSGLFANTALESRGQGGDLTITTGQLVVRDGAQINVSSRNQTNNAKGAGNIDVTAQAIRLDNQGAIAATTASGNGGNIRLNDLKLLLLRRNSVISTAAGTAEVGGNGGDITIDANAGFIVALPQENSDIIANAFKGNGGNIKLIAQSIFGLQPRNDEPTPRANTTSDITASSQFGLSGTVTINTPDIDPSRGLVNLPAELVDASRLVASGCEATGRQGQSKFIVTGRGGLPPTPRETLNSDTVLEDWGTFALASAAPRHERQRDRPENRSSSPAVSNAPTHPTSAPIVEAQGWVIGVNGEVVLTATAPTVTPHNPSLAPADCHET